MVKGVERGALYFYFCIVCVENCPGVHLLLFALFVPIAVVGAGARTIGSLPGAGEVIGDARQKGQGRPGCFYWTYILFHVCRSH